MKRVFIIFLATITAGCATNLTARNDPPKLRYVTTKSLDASLECVVSHMSEVNPWDYAFRGSIVRPGKEYEVHPTREIMVGGEPVFVVVKAIDGATEVTGYALDRLSNIFVGLEAACA